MSSATRSTLKPETQSAPEKETTMPFANIKIPQAALSRAQKEDLIHRTTAMFVDLFGEGVRPTTMVLVEEVADAATAGPTRCSSCRKPIAPGNSASPRCMSGSLKSDASPGRHASGGARWKVPSCPPVLLVLASGPQAREPSSEKSAPSPPSCGEGRCEAARWGSARRCKAWPVAKSQDTRLGDCSSTSSSRSALPAVRYRLGAVPVARLKALLKALSEV